MSAVKFISDETLTSLTVMKISMLMIESQSLMRNNVPFRIAELVTYVSWSFHKNYTLCSELCHQRQTTKAHKCCVVARASSFLWTMNSPLDMILSWSALVVVCLCMLTMYSKISH